MIIRKGCVYNLIKETGVQNIKDSRFIKVLNDCNNLRENILFEKGVNYMNVKKKQASALLIKT